MAKRIVAEKAFGALVDVQEFFLKDLPSAERRRLEKGVRDYLSLLAYLKLPILVTIENPIERKGSLPRVFLKSAATANIMQKDFFDLTKETKISRYLEQLGRRQAIVAGGETDVCVMQSCFGLLELGYDVFVVEDLLFSSSPDCRSARKRMEDAGATLVTFKALFHELLEAQEASKHRQHLTETLGRLPRHLAEY